ncbi:putative 4-hydroxy-4-methyl-2-oxoglutarate aldolase [Sessilibacter sp. MAH2]
MAKISTPDLYDKYEDSLKILDSIFNNYGGNKQFFGEVVTVKCHEDNSLVKSQASVAGEGKVLVVDGGGSLRKALLGDMIAEEAVKNGWAGFVIFGCVRDCDELGALPLGVKALNTIPVKTEKRGLGDLNVPITFAGHTIKPGNWIYCDNNGIVISEEKLEL